MNSPRTLHLLVVFFASFAYLSRLRRALLHPSASLRFLAICFAAAAVAVPSLSPASDPTINTVNRFGYGANIGWTNWRWDTSSPGEGAVIGLNFCEGLIYAANIGWIDLGDGAPANGIAYANASGDFGINVTGIDLSASPPEAQLQGLAYGANIGWINFDNAWNDSPRLNLMTGQLMGFAYGANIGWIDLGSNGVQFVQTDTLDLGPDTDADMIPDPWELEKVLAAGMTTGSQAGDLALLGNATDSDNDSQTDLDEFNAGTDPFDNKDFLRLVTYTGPLVAPTAVTLEWTSNPTRMYSLEGGADLSFGTLMGGLKPDPGANTSILFDASGVLATDDNQFWRIASHPPLAP